MPRSSFKPKGLLIDLDGVIYVQELLIPGATAFIEHVRELHIPHRFVTNTSTSGRRQILKRLAAAGITIPEKHLFTAPLAAASYLHTLDRPRCFFYTSQNVLEDFGTVTHAEFDPTHIVIGDVGEYFSYEMMNRVFTMIMNGAEMIALQKNRYWITRAGLKLDAGAFIAALEYATGKEARVFGKPSRDFFLQACASLDLSPKHVAMIGDDLQADIAGAARAGLQTIFVRTGKDKKTPLSAVEQQPDVELESVADLRGMLKKVSS